MVHLLRTLTAGNDAKPHRCKKEIAMKIIASALVALSVLAGVAAPASAMDAKSFYAQMDRQAN